MRPKRIQRKRTKGWRMPKSAKYVGRPSRWGNDWRVGDVCNRTTHANRGWLELVDQLGQYHARPITLDRDASVEHYRVWATAMSHSRGWLKPLRGKDLACWCPLDQPCHADVLLELANR